MDAHPMSKRIDTTGLNSEAQGVYALRCIGRRDRLPLLAEAIAGDPAAIAALRVIDVLLDTLRRSAGADPHCLLCDGAAGVQPPFLVIVYGFRDDPKHLVAHTVCKNCHTRHRTDAAVREAVLEFYREHVVSDMRLLPPFAKAGRA
jgi:hypothetical protein